MATAGLRTATDIESKELFIYEKRNTSVSGSEIEMIKVEREYSVPGESFQAYQSRLRQSRPRHLYKCIACAEGTASVTGLISKEALSEKGYSLMQE